MNSDYKTYKNEPTAGDSFCLTNEAEDAIHYDDVPYTVPTRDSNGVIGFPAEDYNEEDDVYDDLVE